MSSPNAFDHVPDWDGFAVLGDETSGRVPGGIPLIAQELEKNKVVDWETRDAVQARQRNVVRVVLRKYGYPQSAREEMAAEVLKLAHEATGP